MCFFERIELISLPKLEKLECALWYPNMPRYLLVLSHPLRDLYLGNCFDLDQHELKLSELLHGAAGIHTLTLDFRGENVSNTSYIFSVFTILPQLSSLYHGHASVLDDREQTWL
jgi:hypothetical protein